MTSKKQHKQSKKKSTELFSVVTVISKPESKSASEVGQQLALIINELLKSGELK